MMLNKECVLFKIGMLAVLFCYRQTGIVQLEVKTNVAFEFEFVCHLIKTLFFRNILVDFDYGIQRKLGSPKKLLLYNAFMSLC